MRMYLYGAAVAMVAFGGTLAAVSPAHDGEVTDATAAFDAMVMAEICSVDDVYGMGDDGHMHQPLDVAADMPIPSVTHLVFPDAVDGYNVQILTENFTFTPAAINREVVANEGHGHLYVNGEKIGRIYGHWVHLPSSLLRPGVNVVSVTLNANDHSEWAVDGVPIMSFVQVVVSEGAT